MKIIDKIVNDLTSAAFLTLLILPGCMSEFEPLTDMEIVFVGTGKISNEFLEANGISGSLYQNSSTHIQMTLSSLTFLRLEEPVFETSVDLYDVEMKFDDLSKWDSGPLLIPTGKYDKVRLDIKSIEVGVELPQSDSNSLKDKKLVQRLPLNLPPGTTVTTNLKLFDVKEGSRIVGDMVISVEENSFINDAGDWFIKPEITFWATSVATEGDY